MLQLKCTTCSNGFKVSLWRKNAKFCSQKCYGISIKGKVPKSAFKKGHRISPETEFKKGNKHRYYGKSSPALGKHWTLSETTKDKMSKVQKGIPHPNIADELHPLWKGDNVGYRGLHYWVQRNLGKPDTCEDCGKNGLSGRKIHWANISKKYKRDKKDWKRLCVKCHKNFDSPKR
ncbi:MAG: hypothetical protein AAB922_07235 [Patescibacteria group bacterium]